MTGPTFEIVPHPPTRDPICRPAPRVAVTHNGHRSDAVPDPDNPLRGTR